MNKKGMDQRCNAMKILGNRNWEDYMWPHQVVKTPRLDPEVLSFLKKINLSKLTGLLEDEEVLSMDILLKLNNEDLKELDIKLVHRKIILEEITKVKEYREKMTPIESPSSASSSPKPLQSKHQPTVKVKSQESESPPPPSPEQPASASNPEQCLVKFPYKPVHEDELNLLEGQVRLVVFVCVPK